MKVILFGASGMVGQGVLRECLLDPDVTNVLVVGRSAMQRPDKKFQEIIHQDLFHLEPIEASLVGYDACFFCLGVTSFGLKEADYARVTYDLTLGVAKVLAKQNPTMTFIYVSGQGTDSTEHGRSMWARVKGKIENALLRLPFKAYMFRPGVIQPLHGIKSKTAVYNLFYPLAAPFMPILSAGFPNLLTTTEKVGSAMLAVAKKGFSSRVLEVKDINEMAKQTHV